MLDQRLRTSGGGAAWAGAAYEHKQMRKMVAAIALLVLSLIVVLVRDHQFWFGADQSSGTDQAIFSPVASPVTPPVTVPEKKLVAQTPVRPTPAAPAQPAKRPVAIQVTGAKVQRSVASTAGSSGIHSRIASVVPEAGAPYAPVTNAAQRVRMLDSAATVRQPLDASYPLLSEQAKVEGSVVLQVIIGSDGMIENMRVLSGPAILATAAREAVRNWRFKPYLVNGQAVETSATVTVNLTIKVLDNTVNTAAKGKFPTTTPGS